VNEIPLTGIQFESDHILIPHTNPENISELDWKLVGDDTETYVIKTSPSPRNNIHKGIPTFIT
jgi:hypothetical protein